MCLWNYIIRFPSLNCLSHEATPKLYHKMKPLLKQKLANSNCYQAVLYVHQIVTQIRQVGENEFESTLYKNFYPVKTPQYGDVICLTYYNNINIKYQHVFIRITDRLIFHKTGPHWQDIYEITSLYNALRIYKPRILSQMNEVTVSNLMQEDPYTLCFRKR